MASDHHYPAPHSALPPQAPPPPPQHPPPTPLHPAAIPPPQLSPSRRIVVQPPLITTTVATNSYLHGSLHTPATATSLSLPFSPYLSQSPATHVPSPISASPISASPMASRTPSSVPYNPQQWSRGGPVSGQHVQHAQTSMPTRLSDVTGMEGISLFPLSSPSALSEDLSLFYLRSDHIHTWRYAMSQWSTSLPECLYRDASI